MFGPSFLAAPVVKEGATSCNVYLPSHNQKELTRWLDVGSTMKVSCAHTITYVHVQHLISPLSCVCSMMTKMDDSELASVDTIQEESKSANENTVIV